MSFRQPFKHHRFPAVVILCAVRMYLRYPLSYQDTADLVSERGVVVDRSTVYRWVPKFGPELAKRTDRRRRWISLDWHLDETYFRVGGKWRYLWRAIGPHGQMIYFRLREELDGHEGLGAFVLWESDAHLVEAGLPIFSGVGGGDRVVLDHIGSSSFSMQTGDRDRPDRLSG